MTAPQNAENLLALPQGLDIPACPAVLVELEAEMKKDAPDQRVIARLISRDVSLSGQIMQLVHSPAFLGSRKVASIDQALAVLGFRQVFNLVVAQLLKQALSGLPEATLERFWDSAANIARVSSELARRLRCVSPDVAYTFGLFHDCGIPLIMMRFDNYREVLAEANNAPAGVGFTQVEDERIGTNHATVGYFLARRWKLPDTVAGAIRWHHEFSLLDHGSHLAKPQQFIIALNALAEHVIRMHAQLTVEADWEKARPHVGDLLALAPSELDDLIEDMLDWIEEQSGK